MKDKEIRVRNNNKYWNIKLNVEWKDGYIIKNECCIYGFKECLLMCMKEELIKGFFSNFFYIYIGLVIKRFYNVEIKEK